MTHSTTYVGGPLEGSTTKHTHAAPPKAPGRDGTYVLDVDTATYRWHPDAEIAAARELCAATTHDGAHCGPFCLGAAGLPPA